jgi:hypothetical protein
MAAIQEWLDLHRDAWRRGMPGRTVALIVQAGLGAGAWTVGRR